MIQLKDFDLSVEPSEDFDTFVNGAWKRKINIPSKYSKWGTFEVLHEENTKKVRDIIESCISSKAGWKQSKHQQLIEILYKTGINTNKINNEGIQKIHPLISNIELVQNKEGLLDQISKMHQIGNAVFFFGIYRS